MTWRDNLRGASSEDGFIIANGSGGGLIPQNTNWHDNYMNSFTENGIKIANLKEPVEQVESLPATGKEGELCYVTGENPGMYFYDGDEWVAVGGGSGVSDFNDLSNRPQLNGTQMTGNTNITSFVGTDGQTAGAQGLVPAPATTDADKFLKSDGTWATAGGGGPTVVQTTGSSTTDVMSQDATTKMIWQDVAGGSKVIRIGNNSTDNYAFNTINIGAQYARSGDGIVIGSGATLYANAGGSVVIGSQAKTPFTGGSYYGSVALGYQSGGNITASGMVDVGSTNSSYGYDNTNYRLITGVHNAVGDHDAVTLGQLNALITELQALGLNVSLQGVASNANQNSGSAQTVYCPFCGLETDASSPICENCGQDMTQSPYDPGNGGEEPGPEDPGVEPVDPGEEPVFPGDEPTEPTEPGDEPGPEEVEAPEEG